MWSTRIRSAAHQVAYQRQRGSGKTEPLIEAYVIQTSADFANQPGQSVLNVVAMEPTVR